MTTTDIPAAGAPIPPRPEQPPAVDFTKTAHAPADPGGQAEPDHGPLAAHLRRAGQRTAAWLKTEDLTTEDMASAVLDHRRRQNQARETQLRQELARVSSRIVTAKRTEVGRADNDVHRDGPEVVQLKGQRELLQAQLAEHQEMTKAGSGTPPTDGELSRARWSRKAGRAAGLVGAVVGGGVLLPVQDPRWLLASLPAAAVALWRAGARVENEETGPRLSAFEQVPAQAPEPAQGPAFAAAVLAAQQAVQEVTSPGAAAARQVADAAQEAAQVQGAMDLIHALVQAGIVTRAEAQDTRLVGVIRPDGPGWTATVELPGTATAEEAIAKGTELASALRVKSAQLQMYMDVSDDGHEGRFVIWCANTANPYAGAPVPSELIGAGSWDFWQQGIPLGTNARGVRKILNLLWNSLLIGGLMGYGKSYLARLIASAAVLDPYVRIILLCGKSGADWAALKLVAHSYVSGNTAPVIRDMHAVMEQTIAEMSQHGVRLEQLFESDPKACPEGKVTPALARTEGLELTLLLVDELQEILDAAAGMKLLSADEAEAALEAEGGRRPAGRNGKDVMVSNFARFMRVARYVGGMAVIVTQRPDSNSVPTELREVASMRGSYRVKGAHSARMVLGDDAVAAGASPHRLLDHHKGVVVLDEGAQEGHDTVRADLINLDDFRAICERGRDLRVLAGTLTGYAKQVRERDQAQAAEAAQADVARTGRDRLLADVLAAMDTAGVDRMRSETLLTALTEARPEEYLDWRASRLTDALREAGAGQTERLGPWEGMANPRGYLRQQIADTLTQ
ncbi:hypothetical protein ACFCX4_09030 [Kitasatospora sp. NPDC056327]|uniref:hypothetical protein n=1 Tax=Kitasatospora sp. NPDC056327 TaxID=3345785 RepID=UPI0035DD9E1B